MKTKPAPSPQVRLDPGLSNEIDILRASFAARTSRTAFVEMLIRSGIVAIKTVDKLNELDSRSIAAAHYNAVQVDKSTKD